MDLAVVQVNPSIETIRVRCWYCRFLSPCGSRQARTFYMCRFWAVFRTKKARICQNRSLTTAVQYPELLKTHEWLHVFTK